MTTHQRDKAKVMMLAVLIILWGILHAENISSAETYVNTAHGNSFSGVDRSVIDGVGAPYGTKILKGSCSHCHEPRSMDFVGKPLPGACDRLFYLFADNYGANKNELCFACHDTFDFGYGLGYGRHGIYQGKATYEASLHNTSGLMQWPIPGTPGAPSAPPSNEAGNCLNCHNPHGYADETGLIPHMLFARDSVTGDSPAYEMGCEACHDADGPASKDIKSELDKSHSHPAHDYKDRHTIDESERWQSAFTGGNKHAECVDCHNPHALWADRSTPELRPPASEAPRDENGNKIYHPTTGSGVLQGVWGIDRTSWPAVPWEPKGDWVVLKPPDYPMYAEKEYQICAKCHQSKVNAMRPTRTSRHPVISPGSGVGGQLKPGWTKGVSTMYCSDCHGPYASDVQGPHGSTKNKMLKGSYPGDWRKDTEGNFMQAVSAPGGFCGRCHLLAAPMFHGAGTVHRVARCCQCHPKNVHGSQLNRFSAGGGGEGYSWWDCYTFDDHHCIDLFCP